MNTREEFKQLAATSFERHMNVELRDYIQVILRLCKRAAEYGDMYYSFNNRVETWTCPSVYSFEIGFTTDEIRMIENELVLKHNLSVSSINVNGNQYISIRWG